MTLKQRITKIDALQKQAKGVFGLCYFPIGDTGYMCKAGLRTCCSTVSCAYREQLHKGRDRSSGDSRD